MIKLSDKEWRIINVDELTEGEQLLCEFAASLSDRHVSLFESTEPAESWSDKGFINFRRECVQLYAVEMTKYNLLGVFRYLLPRLSHHLVHKVNVVLLDSEKHDKKEATIEDKGEDFWKQRYKTEKQLLDKFYSNKQAYVATTLRGESVANRVQEEDYVRAAQISHVHIDGFVRGIQERIERAEISITSGETFGIITVRITKPTGRDIRKIGDVFR